jgi:type I restriction enzyme M protein
MEQSAAEGYNLNISRYISTAVTEEDIDLSVVNSKFVEVENKIAESKKKHNEFLGELPHSA